MMEFTKLINTGMVMLHAPYIHKELIAGIVRGVDAPGIWIESETLGEIMHRVVEQKILEGKPLFFVPFSAIAWAVVFLDEPSISETLLDEEPPRP